jgi:hypothetical protein
MNNNEKINIIKAARLLLENGYSLDKSTILIENSYFKNVSEEDMIQVHYKLKAIRQDYAKILVILNVINRIYSLYQKEKYVPSYFSPRQDQATSELGCFIEYLYAKYRVMLEYIYQILVIIIPPRFDEEQEKEYNKLRKEHIKYKFLLKYVAENVEDRSQVVNMEWFQNIRIERDFIIHDGATCLVYGDKTNLMYNVMNTDALDKEDEKDEEDALFLNEQGLIYYTLYWRVNISQLLVFSNTVFEFLKSISSISNDRKSLINKTLYGKTDKYVDDNGTQCPDVQDILINMLNSKE